MGRVEPARDADHELLAADRVQPLQQRVDLDVVDLHAALVERRRVGRDVGEAVDLALQRERELRRHGEAERHAAERAHPLLVLLDRVAERVQAHALARDALEVDVGADEVRADNEPLRFGEQVAALVDQRLAVPAEVGRRFAEPGRRVQVGGEAARRLHADEAVPVVGLADRDVRCRQVDQHRRAGERGIARRRDRHPDVLADLAGDLQERQVGRLEDQVGAEGHVGVEQAHRGRHRGVAGLELARLVELAVVRQVGLRHDAEDAAVADHRRAIEEAMVDAQRQADDGDRRDRGGRRGDAAERDLAGVEQGALVEQVVAGVGREAQLGEGDHDGALRRGLLEHPDRLAGVVGRIGDADVRHGDGDAREAVAVGVEEIAVRGTHCRLLVPRPRGISWHVW